jgi:hypothetical protein
MNFQLPPKQLPDLLLFDLQFEHQFHLQLYLLDLSSFSDPITLASKLDNSLFRQRGNSKYTFHETYSILRWIKLAFIKIRILILN